jgi:transforming growth factor-beta-induced protein
MRKIALNLGSLLLGATLILGTTSCEKEEDNTPTPQQSKTIADVAAENGNFTILLDALERTDLTDAVSDENANLTVFAPTDQAFADLLTELNLPDLDAVEAALGTDGLKTVLLYHVLGAKVTSDMVSTGYVSTLGTTADDDALSLYIKTGNDVMINDRATVGPFDVMADNGVIHVLDKVILPMTIYQLLEVNEEYSSLVTALGAADGDIDDLLNDVTAGPFTLFAPDNEAFGDLLAELSLPDLTAVVGALGTDGLADVLLYHAVSGNVNSDEVPTGSVPTALAGQNISISTSSGVVITDSSNRTSTVESFDIQGVNGVIHGINTVLLPN